MSANTKPLIPLNAKMFGKPIGDWKRDETTVAKTPEAKQKNIITPKSFGNVVPLIGSDKKTKEFTVMEALVEAKSQNKIIADLNKETDAYVLKNGGYYWLGRFITYPAPDAIFGKEIRYKDGNGKNYLMEVPQAFQKFKGDNALMLPYGVHSDGSPRFEFNFDKASDLWVVSFNKADDLIQSNLLTTLAIKRKDGYYQTDASMFPNGKSADGKGANERYFWQVDGGPYLGLLRRDDDYDWQDVVANRRPSGRCGVLVRE